MDVLQKRFCRRNEPIASLCGIDCSAFPSEGFLDELNLPMTSLCLDATGQPYEELPWRTVPLPPGRRQSIAETLRIGRKLAQQRNHARAAAEDN
jgi:hypothetical protein